MKESPEGPAVASVSVPPGAAWDGWRGCQEPLQAMSKHSSAGRLQSAAMATHRCEPGHAVPARQPAGPSALHGERAQPGAVPSLRDPAVPTGPAGGFAARSEDTQTRLEGLVCCPPRPRLTAAPGRQRSADTPSRPYLSRGAPGMWSYLAWMYRT